MTASDLAATARSGTFIGRRCSGLGGRWTAERQLQFCASPLPSPLLSSLICLLCRALLTHTAASSAAAGPSPRVVPVPRGEALALRLLVANEDPTRYPPGVIQSRDQLREAQQAEWWAGKREYVFAALAAGWHITMFSINLAFWGNEGMPQDRYWPASPRCVAYVRVVASAASRHRTVGAATPVGRPVEHLFLPAVLLVFLQDAAHDPARALRQRGGHTTGVHGLPGTDRGHQVACISRRRSDSKHGVLLLRHSRLATGEAEDIVIHSWTLQVVQALSRGVARWSANARCAGWTRC
jgi:hypothetical protein